MMILIQQFYELTTQLGKMKPAWHSGASMPRPGQRWACSARIAFRVLDCCLPNQDHELAQAPPLLRMARALRQDAKRTNIGGTSCASGTELVGRTDSQTFEWNLDDAPTIFGSIPAFEQNIGLALIFPWPKSLSAAFNPMQRAQVL